MTLDGIENLNLNVNLTVFAPDNRQNNNPSSRLFKGKISGKASDHIVIQLETAANSDILPDGKPIFLFLAHDLGLYIFSAVVSQKEFKENNVVLSCSKPQQIKYFQRRNSVRVNIRIPVSFSVDFNRSRVWDGSITNISVGGVQLEAPFTLPINSNLELVYQLEDVGPVFTSGRVVRAYEKDGKLVHGIEFTNTDQYTMDGIAKYIAVEQMRQKRLGLQVFKAFIFNAVIAVQAPTVFGILQYKNLDVSALQGKKCSGTVTEIGIHSLTVECSLKIPLDTILEFFVELPKLGEVIIRAIVKEVRMEHGKYVLSADFLSDYEKIRDSILENLTKDIDLRMSG